MEHVFDTIAIGEQKGGGGGDSGADAGALDDGFGAVGASEQSTGEGARKDGVEFVVGADKRHEHRAAAV